MTNWLVLSPQLKKVKCRCYDCWTAAYSFLTIESKLDLFYLCWCKCEEDVLSLDWHRFDFFNRWNKHWMYHCFLLPTLCSRQQSFLCGNNEVSLIRSWGNYICAGHSFWDRHFCSRLPVKGRVHLRFDLQFNLRFGALPWLETCVGVPTQVTNCRSNCK
jgi:hypothetical protein